MISGGRLRSSSREIVGHWISVHYRTFCVDLHVMSGVLWTLRQFVAVGSGHLTLIFGYLSWIENFMIEFLGKPIRLRQDTRSNSRKEIKNG
jgi:hypothetical protein